MADQKNAAGIKIPAAYWTKSKGEEFTAHLNCTQYTRFDNCAEVSGYAYVGSVKPEYFIKHLRLSVFDVDSNSWCIIYENKNVPKADSLKILLEKSAKGRSFKAEFIEHHGRNYSHKELVCSSKSVPFNSLDNYSWITTGTGDSSFEEKTLKREQSDLPETENRCGEGSSVTLTNDFMTIAFSSSGPKLTYLNIHDLPNSKPDTNLILCDDSANSDMSSGPRVLSILPEASLETENRHQNALKNAKVTIGKNSISYHDVSPIKGLCWNYEFSLEKDALYVSIEQIVERQLRLIECEAWRCYWNLKSCIPANLAYPVQKGKSGRCRLPAVINFPGQGAVLIEAIDYGQSDTYVKADSWRRRFTSMTGLECGVDFYDDGELMLEPGTTRILLKITPIDIGLDVPDKCASELHPAFKSAWPNIFGFRPEYYGMSNNSASLNCHFVQHTYADMAVYTIRIKDKAMILDLCAYSLELALNGGSGYGAEGEYFLDTCSSILIGSKTYILAANDLNWAKRNYSNFQRLAQRLTALQLPNGLIASQRLTGNSGEHEWSSNWWDVISFGYLDAFSNAYSYKAFLSVAEIAALLGNNEEAELYRKKAALLKSSYFDCFYNDEIGWLGGWRSKDGKLHDYGFLFVNGIAIESGLVPEKYVRPIMERLEIRRKEVGFTDFSLGLPGNIIPIRREDYALNVFGSPLKEDGSDTFGIYENGGATMSQAYHYLRALSISGIEEVREIEEQILSAFEKGGAYGGMGSGLDWKEWNGKPCGYEGMLSDQFYVLLAVARNRGYVT